MDGRNQFGQPIDDQTGLYFYQSRYYDPQLGRFTQADTIVPSADTSQALNRYAYVKNNPLKFTDPDGHGWFSDIWKKIKGFIGIIVTVALTPFVGPIFASIIGSAVGTLVNGGTWKSFAIGVGIGLAAGVIANAIGGYLAGGDFYWKVCVSDTWRGAFTAGALTGAIAGGISSAVYGTNVGRGMLEGMYGGAIGTAVGMATSTVLETGKKFIAGMNATAEATPDEVQLIASSDPNFGIGDPNCLASIDSPYSIPADPNDILSVDEAMITIHVRRGTPWGETSLQRSMDGEYGHVWVELIDQQGRLEVGSYPTGLRYGPSNAGKTGPSISRWYKISQKKAAYVRSKIAKYGNDNYYAPSENCADFGYHVIERWAGQNLPGTDWGIDYPDKLADGLRKWQKKGQ